MKRLLSLDSLRGAAVLLVLFHHLPNAGILTIGGWVGVDLFFVLSGFLVSGLLFKQHAKQGKIHAVDFLVRRGFKIYPAFWVFLTLSAGFFSIVGLDNLGPKLWSEALFVTNYTYDSVRLWRHTWSLAVEEHFYLLLPLLLLGIQRDRFRALPRIVLMICVAVFACKLINFFRPFSFGTHYTPTHLRIDALFFGVLLSYWHHYWPEFNDYCRSRSGPLFWMGILLLLPAFLCDIEHNRICTSVWMTPLYLGAGMILMSLVTAGVPENRATKALGFVGKYSYSIYLWHIVITDLVVPATGLSAIVAIPTAIALGVVMSELIETPLLRVREWLTTTSREGLRVCLEHS